MKRFIIVGITFLMLFSCTEKPTTDTLLKLGNDYYSLIDFFEDNSRQSFVKFPDKIKKEKINEWAVDKLMMKEATKLYGEDEKLQNQIEDRKNNYLIRTYLNKSILDSIITQKVLRDIYDRYRTEIKVSHILLKFSDQKNDEFPTKEEALVQAKKIEEQAKNGVSFPELADRYSDDTESLPGGNLGWAGTGDFVQPFEDKMFELKPGEISEPVLSRYGYHIIKVHDRRFKQTRSFADLKERIKQQAIRKHRKTLNNEYRNLIDGIKEDINYELNNEKIEELITKFGEYNKVSANSSDPLKAFFNDVDIEGSLVRTSEKDYDMEWFKDNYMMSSFRPPHLKSIENFKRFLEKEVLTKYLVEMAKKADIQIDDKFKKNMNKYKSKVLLNKYIQNEIYNKIKLSDEEIKQYYEKHKYDKYGIPERFEVREIFVRDRELLDSLKQELEKGANFDTLSAQYTERKKRGEKPGYYGYIRESQYGKIGREASTLTKNTVSDSILEIGNGYSLIKVYGKKDKEPKPYDKLKTKITVDLRKERKTEAKQEYIEKLKDKYNFKIYWDTVNLN